METKLEEAKWVHSRYDQLNFIEEKRFMALYHKEYYQKRIARAYSKNNQTEKFQLRWSLSQKDHAI